MILPRRRVRPKSATADYITVVTGVTAFMSTGEDTSTSPRMSADHCPSKRHGASNAAGAAIDHVIGYLHETVAHLHESLVHGWTLPGPMLHRRSRPLSSRYPTTGVSTGRQGMTAPICTGPPTLGVGPGAV